jgi:hypothetical protein
MMFAPLGEPEDKGIHEDSRMVDGEKNTYWMNTHSTHHPGQVDVREDKLGVPPMSTSAEMTLPGMNHLCSPVPGSFSPGFLALVLQLDIKQMRLLIRPSVCE